MIKKSWLMIFLILFVSVRFTYAKTDEKGKFRNFPVVLSVRFHALSMPFRDFKSNFRNIGIGLGTEVSYNGKNNWIQEFTVIWYRNKAMGNGLHVSTCAAWRPYISRGFYGETKAGLGYLISFRPVASFIQENGQWVNTGKKGQSMLTLIAGIGAGYHEFLQGVSIAPFGSYQIMLLRNYSKDFPVIPETMMGAGLRIHP